ncbi:MAG TPA: DUF998 domain-containing protein [Anaerolineales bacterium]|jgi:hypothetical protein|nr:DUF998 domain-containing protein [Anaerolineales bacterium]
MLLITGASAGPLFTIAWFVEAFLHADYDSMRHAVSSLSRGNSGWMQDVNFLLTGVLTLSLAWGVWNVMRSRNGSIRGPILLVIAAIGFIGSSFFKTDPLNGYPPGTPVLPVPPTLTGWLHLLFAACIFGLPAAGFMLAGYFDGRDERTWAVYSRVSALAFIVLYLITIAAFLQVDGLADFAGLLQRISLTIILAWLTLLPVYLLKSPASRQAPVRD